MGKREARGYSQPLERRCRKGAPLWLLDACAGCFWVVWLGWSRGSQSVESKFLVR